MNNIASFKVGDVIVAISNKYYCTSLSKNWEGVIISDEGVEFIVRTTRSNDPDQKDEIGEIWVLDKEDFHQDFAHSKSNNFKTIYQILNNENQP